MPASSAVAESTARAPRMPFWRQPRKWIAGYLFASPAIVLIVVFSLLSIIISLYISFFEYDVISPNPRFLGLGNYREAVVADGLVSVALKNTALYVIGVVPAVAIGGFLLALVGSRIRAGRSIFRTLFFLPSITPMVVVAMVWVWFYAPSGLLNEILKGLGIRGPNWLFDQHLAMPSVMVVSIWSAVGYYTVIYLAGLADIPQDFHDAARVDGANSWQEMLHVTIPLLRNVTAFVMVTLAIGAFQVFTQMYVMTKGGPGTATVSMQLVIFRNAFQYMRMGYASALSWVLFLVIFALVVVQMRLNRSQQLF